MALSRPAKEAISAIIQANPNPVSCWGLLQACLLDHGLAWRQKLKVEELMVSSENRAGLGVNAYNCHKLGQQILQVGADLKELAKATCVELSQDSAKAAAQFDFNKKLSAGGLLAEPTGRERYLTVSCSHTSQFLKAVNQHKKSAVPELSSIDGHLYPELFFRDPVYKQMLQDGWEWLIISSKAHSCFPEIGSIAEKALNCSNNLGQSANELEIMSRIAHAMKASPSEKVDWKKIAADAVLDAPPCAPYAAILASFVQLYSDGGALVAFLDAFSKKYSHRIALGQEFFTHVVSLKAKTKANMCMYLRTAAVATNLISPKAKIQDGIGRLISKTDLATLLKHKSAELAEELLARQWVALTEQVQKQTISSDSLHSAFGRLCSRVVLHLLKKEKLGYENKCYKSLEEIEEKVQHDAAGTGIEDDTDKSDEVDAAEKAKAATSNDTTDRSFIAKSQGYAEKKLYVNKAKDLIKILEMTKEDIKIVKLDVIKGNTEGKISYEQLYEFKLWRGSEPTKIDIPQGKMAHESEDVKKEAVKASVFCSLFSKEAESPRFNESFELAFNPSKLIAKKPFSKNELKFFAVTDSLSRISFKKSNGARLFQTGEEAWPQVFIAKPSTPTDADVAKWGKVVVALLWLVTPTDDQSLANMVYCNDECCMTNHKDIEAGDVLMEYVSKSAEQAKLEMKPVEKDGDGNEEDAKEGGKKRDEEEDKEDPGDAPARKRIRGKAAA